MKKAARTFGRYRSWMASLGDPPIPFFFSETGTIQTTVAEHLGPSEQKEALRLITAFGQIAKIRRKKLLALVESMVQVKRSKGKRRIRQK